TLTLARQSLAAPSRAPAGKHTLWGYAHVPAVPTADAARPRARAGWDRSTEPFLERMEGLIEAHAPGFPAPMLGRGAGGDRSPEPFLERMEGLIEAHAPGFRDRILARRAWNPRDLEAADATLAGGDISADRKRPRPNSQHP